MPGLKAPSVLFWCSGPPFCNTSFGRPPGLNKYGLKGASPSFLMGDGSHLLNWLGLKPCSEAT